MFPGSVVRNARVAPHASASPQALPSSDSTKVSVNICRTSAADAAPDAGACEFPLPRRVARQQQRGQVARACDQQDQANRSHQQQENLPQIAGPHGRQR